MSGSSGNDELKAVCSIVEMADKVGLSRIRFYQLRQKGIFPDPVQEGYSKACYTLELQRKCLEIRKTGIGYNGQHIFFNKTRKRTRRRSRKSKTRPQNIYELLAGILRQWKRNVTHIEVKRALNSLYPQGLAKDIDEGKVLRNLIDYFNNTQFECSNKEVK